MDELSEYLMQKEEWLKSVLKRLGWTIEGLQKVLVNNTIDKHHNQEFLQDKLTRCPRNEHHYVLDSKAEKHLHKCGQEVYCMHTD